MTTAQVAPGWYNDGTGQQRWWDGQQWTNHYAHQATHAPQLIQTPQQTVVVQRQKMYKTSHGFHLVMSLITLGLWLPVWLIVGLYNASKA